MASPSTPATTTTFALPRLRDLIEHDEDDDSVEDEEEGDDDEEEDWDIRNRMSLLTVEGSDGGDADDEDDGSADVDEEEDEDEVRSAGVHGEYESQPWHPYESPRNHLKPPSSASLPGTPERGAPSQSPWRYSKDYASETEAGWWPGAPHDKRGQHYRRQRMMREVWLDRAWQTRKQRRMLGERGDEVTVVVGKGGESPARGGVGVAMDMEEVRACKDLGFDLPCDWTVEIPSYAVPNADTASSGGNSPASGSWRISSPGDDPKDVKARLKVWAQAVALTSTSRLGS